MRVERLNDHQIQFILLPQDLADRDITINDIITQSGTKTQGLFQEITQLLQSEYNFYSMGTSLVFEARMAHDSLCIVVTKMDQEHSVGGQNIQSIIGDFMTQLNSGQFSHEMLPPPPQDDMNNVPHRPQRRPRPRTGQGDAIGGRKPQARQEHERDCDILSFPDFDMLAMAATKIPDRYMGYSYVCKKEGKYFLIMEYSEGAGDSYSVTRYMPKLCEYGTKVPSSPIAQYQLKECGEVIIANDAIQKLKLYHG